MGNVVLSSTAAAIQRWYPRFLCEDYQHKTQIVGIYLVSGGGSGWHERRRCYKQRIWQDSHPSIVLSTCRSFALSTGATAELSEWDDDDSSWMWEERRLLRMMGNINGKVPIPGMCMCGNKCEGMPMFTCELFPPLFLSFFAYLPGVAGICVNIIPTDSQIIPSQYPLPSR